MVCRGHFPAGSEEDQTALSRIQKRLRRECLLTINDNCNYLSVSSASVSLAVFSPCLPPLQLPLSAIQLMLHCMSVKTHASEATHFVYCT